MCLPLLDSVLSSFGKALASGFYESNWRSFEVITLFCNKKAIGTYFREIDLNYRNTQELKLILKRSSFFILRK